jgi:ABC-type transport system involved in multi-copper enzyme maturation permease subunit
MSEALRDKTELEPGDDWQSPPEMAPSTLRRDEPRLARWIGGIGLLLLALAGWALLLQATWGTWIGPGTRVFLITVGLGCLLFHASRDPDLQVRRTYGVFGFACLILAVLLSAMPVQGTSAALFLPYGFLCLPLALLFLMAFAHHEKDPQWRRVVVGVIGLAAIILAGTGFIGGNVSTGFLLPYGLLLSLVGLGYWWAFIGLHGTSSQTGYWAGMAMGATGVVVFLAALCRSALPPLLHSWGWTTRAEASYLTSSGLVLMTLGAIYAALAAGLCSDHRLIVLTRRELAAFFYSPIAYIVLLGLTFVGLCLFFIFVRNIVRFADQGSGLPEPIVQWYIIDFVPVVTVIIVVPILTMRLLSEERRTGTLEVLLTAPLDEVSIVLSKFLAAWIFFMCLWIPWGLFLVALRVEGGQTFDYRPLLSFFIGLSLSGASFLGMGLFFSSVTRNQIAAAVLSFMGMMFLTSLFFVVRMAPPGSNWSTALTHMSFINLWVSNVEGKLVPRDLLFPISACVLWLFLTVKVLEARKWS